MFYFPCLCPFCLKYNWSLLLLFCFHFPEFYFLCKSVILQRSVPLLFSIAMPRRSIDTENPVVRRSHREKHKSVFWICVISLTLSKPGWSKTSIPFVKVSPGEKKKVLTSYVLFDKDDLDWYGFQLKHKYLCSGFCRIQVPVLASLCLECQQYCHISYCNHWIFK